MHLKRVAVPVRLSLSKIGEANILCARTRPKLIGGERAKYTEEARTQGKLAYFRGCSKSFKKSLYKFHIFSQYHCSSDEKQRILFRFCFISLIST